MTLATAFIFICVYTSTIVLCTLHTLFVLFFCRNFINPAFFFFRRRSINGETNARFFRARWFCWWQRSVSLIGLTHVLLMHKMYAGVAWNAFRLWANVHTESYGNVVVWDSGACDGNGIVAHTHEIYKNNILRLWKIILTCRLFRRYRRWPVCWSCEGYKDKRAAFKILPEIAEPPSTGDAVVSTFLGGRTIVLN